MKTINKVAYALSALVIFTACGNDSSTPKAASATTGEDSDANSYSSFDLAKRINEAVEKTEKSLDNEGRSREETKAVVWSVALNEYNTALKEKPGTAKNALEAILMIESSDIGKYLWKTYTFGSPEKAVAPYDRKVLETSLAELMSLTIDADRSSEFKNLKDGKTRIRLEVAEKALSEIDEEKSKLEDKGTQIRNELRNLRIDTTSLTPIPDAPVEEVKEEVAPELKLSDIDPRPENTAGKTIAEIAEGKRAKAEAEFGAASSDEFERAELAAAQNFVDEKFETKAKEAAQLKKEADARIAAAKATRKTRQSQVIAAYKAHLENFKALQANREVASQRVAYLRNALSRGESYISDISNKLDEVERDEAKAREEAQKKKVVEQVKGMQK